MTPKVLARLARLLTLVLSSLATAPAAARAPVVLAPLLIETQLPAPVGRGCAVRAGRRGAATW